jgi:hypothetical protein
MAKVGGVKQRICHEKENSCALVIASEAKQSSAASAARDCVVAMLLAMAWLHFRSAHGISAFALDARLRGHDRAEHAPQIVAGGEAAVQRPRESR